ncbi:tyrosine-type recombinase/integrase [Alishewanella sp. d11]|uniref:tyrosine-type recombinase/integrase n=1 Tax=Alishewanella sp. d11 TaxID=3414030 RepID=UPI003BF7B621
MALSQEQVALFVPSEKDYKISDEKGLQLLVKKSGKKFWRLRYWILDKEKTLSLGSFPEVSLDQARAEQKTALEMLARGIDPSLNRQLKKTIGATANLNSFETVAREWFCVRMANKSLTHQKRTQSILDNHLLPVLGRFDLDQLTSLAVLEALRRIENTGAVETAHRAKNICSLIFVNNNPIVIHPNNLKVIHYSLVLSINPACFFSLIR